jgi:hypothetical protein
VYEKGMVKSYLLKIIGFQERYKGASPKRTAFKTIPKFRTNQQQ